MEKLSANERKIVNKNFKTIGMNMAVQMGGQVKPNAGQHIGYACNQRTNSHVTKFYRLRGETGFDIAQTFSVSQLNKNKRSKLIGTRKTANLVVATITSDDTEKRRPGKETHQLGKRGLADIHAYVSGKYFPEAGLKLVYDSTRHHLNFL